MSLTLLSILILLSIAAIVILTSWLKLKAFASLFIVSLLLAFAALPAESVVSTLKEGFGSTMASIGFLIIFGAMIGIILDKTGATLSIAKYILSKTGSKRSTQAMGITGYVTGLPIFCDSGFIVLSGLARSMSSSTGTPMVFAATVLATSLYSVHCLIPPHPGALAAAGTLNVNPGLLIIYGMLLAIPGAIAAFYWSRWMTRGKEYPPAEANISEKADPRDLPSPLAAMLPILIPLSLITMKSLIMLTESGTSTLLYKIIRVPGEPVFALAAGVIASLFLIRKINLDKINDLFGSAIEKAGPVLIITAAGGMFGMVIKATGIGAEAGKVLGGTGVGLLVPFLFAVLLKSAQGSSTVAIITAATFMIPLMGTLGLDSENGRLLTLLSMGAGSMIASHANDSYFWVVSGFSGIDTKSALRVYTTSTIVMGTVIFALILLLSLIML